MKEKLKYFFENEEKIIEIRVTSLDEKQILKEREFIKEFINLNDSTKRKAIFSDKIFNLFYSSKTKELSFRINNKKIRLCEKCMSLFKGKVDRSLYFIVDENGEIFNYEKYFSGKTQGNYLIYKIEYVYNVK